MILKLKNLYSYMTINLTRLDALLNHSKEEPDIWSVIQAGYKLNFLPREIFSKLRKEKHQSHNISLFKRTKADFLLYFKSRLLVLDIN